LRQRENDAVVVHREVENRIGHLLIRIGIPTESAAGYECRRAGTARGAKIINRWSCSPGAGIAGQTAVKRFRAYAQYAVCAQKRLRVFVSPRASAWYAEAGIRDNLN
jgi:hypothetical protein